VTCALARSRTKALRRDCDDDEYPEIELEHIAAVLGSSVSYSKTGPSNGADQTRT
jgi:hypothetical protein